MTKKSSGPRALLVAALTPALLLCPASPPATATTKTSPSAAMAAFVDAYWDPQAQYFYGQSTHQPTHHGNSPQEGVYADFWWEARLWEVVMDGYETTGEARYRQMIDQVYDGFLRQFPTFGSDFNDDIGWWAMGSVRAWEITGNQRYLHTAEQLYARIMTDEDSQLGGGVWWRSDRHDQKNTATNAPLAVTGVRLYRATGDAKYLADAKRLFTFVDTHLQENGHLYDHIDADGTLVKWDFTYDFGTYISAATYLFEETRDRTYFTKALAAADWVSAKLTNGGTFRNEGIGDGGGFKSLLIRALDDLVERHGQTQYLSQLQNSATQAWSHRRPSDDLMSNDWSAPTTKHAVEALAASSGLTAVLLVEPDGVKGIRAENGIYEAENANVVGLNTEANGTGWTGRGYLAGWNQDGQQVTMHTNVAKKGCYLLRFRYAADNGQANRMVMVNSQVVAKDLVFPSTGDWGNWRDVVLKQKLAKGHNSVQLRLDGASDNHNYINFDKLRITGC